VVDDSSRSAGEIEGAFRTLKWRFESYLSAIVNERLVLCFFFDFVIRVLMLGLFFVKFC